MKFSTPYIIKNLQPTNGKEKSLLDEASEAARGTPFHRFPLRFGGSLSLTGFNDLKILPFFCYVFDSSRSIKNNRTLDTDYLKEYKNFYDLLRKIQNRSNPVMIEVGSGNALWSLIFREVFPNGKNILLEPETFPLRVGEINFELNNYSYSSYKGAILPPHLGEIGASYPPFIKYTPDIIEVTEIYEKENLNLIDLLHMDIQGCESWFMTRELNKFLLKEKILNIVIATHAPEIHETLEKQLENNGFDIISSIPHLYSKTPDEIKILHKERKDNQLRIPETDGLICASKNT